MSRGNDPSPGQATKTLGQSLGSGFDAYDYGPTNKHPLHSFYIAYVELRQGLELFEEVQARIRQRRSRSFRDRDEQVTDRVKIAQMSMLAILEQFLVKFKGTYICNTHSNYNI